MPPKRRRIGNKKKKNTEPSSYPKFELKPNPLLQDPCSPVKSARTRSNDNGVVAQISPFNRFGGSTIGDKVLSMPYQGIYKSAGLSPKEKSYVICSCQARTARYLKLKSLANTAMKEGKIFSIHGACNAVRKALLERGWVERIPANRMNLSKIKSGKFRNKTEIHGELERLLLSNLVEKSYPNFIWRSGDDISDSTIDMNKENNTIVNKLKIDASWTNKQGLCSSIKRIYWFYIENVAEVNCPRTYNSSEAGEIDDFVKDYKITACTSLLKWVLSMVANDRPVFQETGNVSLNVIVFAINRCKEYLFRKQNKDIDRSLASVSTGQWNGFLKKYYRIIEKEDVFQADVQKKLPLYLCYAKILLKEIHKYRPQLSCEGCHNIWIIKPTSCSRGRGIRLASKLGVMTNLLNKHSKYVIQKYMEEPLLIHDTKFDIRQYFLVTSTYPLIIWCYTECYLKFSSQKYSLKDYHESIHLTNNAVQRKYKNCSGRHPDLPPQNMWDLDTYKEYLIKNGRDHVWDSIIYPGMTKSIISIMLSCQDSLSVSKNRFELYGCDFILDKEYKPWLIEINSCPDLNHTTPVTAKICPAAISDIIKVVIDHASDPNAPTGNFECIYHQPMTIPRYGTAADLVVKGYELPNEYFYKGNIEIKESYENTDISKETDLKAVLQKLKQYYDVDIMMDLEEGSETCDKKVERETCTHVTESEDDMSVAAVVITEQIRDLMDRITSDNTNSCKSPPLQDTVSFDSSKSTSPLQSARSDIDFNSLVAKTCSRNENVNVKKSFSFSKLDDGPFGKASCFDLVSFLNLPNDKKLGLCGRDVELTPSQKNIAEATSKLISFMNKKKKEYLGP